MKKHLFSFCLAACCLLATVGCTDEENDLGLGLSDQNTLWEGTCDTLFANIAYSQRDDSLRTSGYTFCIVGNYADNVFGKVSSTLYMQMTLPSTASAVNLSSVSVDSVVLSLVKDNLYPDPNGSYNFHIEVKQLANAISADSTYYSTQNQEVDESATFFDHTVAIAATDTIIRLKMNPAIYPLLTREATLSEFLENTKGLCVRFGTDSDLGMLTLNMGATQTRLTVYYKYGDDTVESEYHFPIGGNAAHYTYFEHDYTGTRFEGLDKIDGKQKLYLEPLGGYNIRISFDSCLQVFRAQHPRAVIHYAEMLVPVADEADTNLPDRLLALTTTSGGNDYYIADLTDSYTYSGYDGYPHGKTYRIRVTQSLQNKIIEGADHGTLLAINSRRDAANRTIINGPAVSADPIRIVFTYSEQK